MLNLNQSPEELDGPVHGEDYYWYLRHPAYVKAVLSPAALLIRGVVDTLGEMSQEDDDGVRLLDADRRVLDVGCGEAMLADMLSNCLYTGFDGSQVAIGKAKERMASVSRARAASVLVGRIEDPPMLGTAAYDVAVFGGVLSVLVDPRKQLEFFQLYRERFGIKVFIVIDLPRVEFDEGLEVRFSLDTFAPVPDLDEARCRRRMSLVFIRGDHDEE